MVGSVAGLEPPLVCLSPRQMLERAGGVVAKYVVLSDGVFIDKALTLST